MICSRQNQEQSTGFPFLQQGSLQRIVSFSTDGYQFYGLDYKINNQIAKLQSDVLDNKVYQYEFAYSVLQTETIPLGLGKEAHIVFYGLVLPNHTDAVEKPVAAEFLVNAHEGLRFDDPEQWYSFSTDIDVNQTLPSESFSLREIERLYPVHRHEEKKDDALLSFFTKNSEHVVLMEKEKYIERSHGHIIIRVIMI